MIPSSGDTGNIVMHFMGTTFSPPLELFLQLHWRVFIQYAAMNVVAFGNTITKLRGKSFIYMIAYNFKLAKDFEHKFAFDHFVTFKHLLSDKLITVDALLIAFQQCAF